MNRDTKFQTANYEDYPEWDNIVINSYNLILRIIQDEDCCIKLFINKPIWGRAKISTGAYGTGGGILCSKKYIEETTIKQLRNLLCETNAKYVLLKSRKPIFRKNQNEMIIDDSYCTFILDIRLGIDDVWEKKIKSKTRNQIRKGLKHKLKIKIGHSDLLEEFYYIISRCWRDLGTPTHKKKFYYQIIKNFGDRSKMIVIYYKDKPVSCALMIICKNTIHHPFAATIKDYNKLSINNVLYWNIIQYAIKNGIQYFDMGRSRYNQGTYKYKLSWGAETQPLYYNYLVKDKGEIPNYTRDTINMATKAWKKIPVPIANFVGPTLIKGVL